jgi:hypothetical protein
MRLACGSFVACSAVLWFGVAPALAQSQERGSGKPSGSVPRQVRKLWSEYPLNPDRAPAARTRPSTTERAAPSSQSQDESSVPVLALVAAVAGVAVGLAALALLLSVRPARALVFARGSPDVRKLFPTRWPRRSKTPRQERFSMNDSVRRFLARLPKRDTYSLSLPDAVATPASEPLPSPDQGDTLASDSAGEQERSDTLKQPEPATPSTSGGNESYGQVGEEVAAVLASAHEAAEKIREAARQEAERLRGDTESYAEQSRRESEELRTRADEYSNETREAADRYADETRQRTREAADSYASEARQRLEEEIAKRRAEAEKELRAIRTAAEQKAKAVETEALERQKALIDEARRSEARLEQLLGVFHGMTSQLEELVRSDRPGQSNDAKKQAPQKQLAEDLKPEHSRAGRA